MPKEIFYTILGGILSAATGLLLFFIQRHKEKKDDDQRTLFNIYKLLKMLTVFQGRSSEQMLEASVEQSNRWKEAGALSLLLSDKKIGREIFFILNKRPLNRVEIDEIPKKIQKRLNKYLLPIESETGINPDP